MAPRETRRPPPSRRGNQSTVRQRRAVAAAVGIALLIAVVFLIKGCRDSARDQSFRDYVSNVDSIMNQSNGESSALFGLLTSPGSKTAVEMQSAINGYRTDATQLVAQAQAAGHPDELTPAARYVVDVLEFRRDGIGQIADQLPGALGDGDHSAPLSQISLAMQGFLTSDVLFADRVVPNLSGPLQQAGLLQSVTLPNSRFLPNLTWVSGSTLSGRMGAIRTGIQSGSGTQQLSLGSVIVRPGGESLSQSGATQIAASPNLAFDVSLTNQAQSTARDVVVKLMVSGGASPIEVDQQVSSIGPGGQQTVTIPLAASPPTGQSVTITVEASTGGTAGASGPKQTFAAIFGG